MFRLTSAQRRTDAPATTKTPAGGRFAMYAAEGILMPTSSMPTSNSRYGAVAQLFHWATVLLVGAAYLLSPGGQEQRIYSAAMETTRAWHESMGLILFALVLLRVLWRLSTVTPEPARSLVKLTVAFRRAALAP